MQFEVKTNSNSAKHYLIIIHSTAFFAEPCIFLFNFCRIIDKTLIEIFSKCTNAEIALINSILYVFHSFILPIAK